MIGNFIFPFKEQMWSSGSELDLVKGRAIANTALGGKFH